MYLGMAMILLGSAFFLGSLTSLICPVIFIVIIEKNFIPMEEKNLEKKFGRKYFDYKNKIRKWI